MFGEQTEHHVACSNLLFLQGAVLCVNLDLDLYLSYVDVSTSSEL